jgi:hypothetical protein
MDMEIPLLVAGSIANRTDLLDAPRVHRRPQRQRVAGFQSRAPETGHRGEPGEVAKDPARSAQSSAQLGEGQFQPGRVHPRQLGLLTLLEGALL